MKSDFGLKPWIVTLEALRSCLDLVFLSYFLCYSSRRYGEYPLVTIMWRKKPRSFTWSSVTSGWGGAPLLDRNGIQGLKEGSTDILAGKGQGTSFFRAPHVASVDTVGRWLCDCWLSTSPLWYHPHEGEVGLSQYRLVGMKVQAPHMFFPDTGK